MEEIILNCEFITPAFIYGVNNYPEIRAASIKGLMRFWWRASYDKFKNVEEMKKEEAEIFGGIIKEKDKKETKYKAKVQIVTKIDNGDDDKCCNSEIFNKKFKDLDGCKYLFYTTNLNGNKQKGYFEEGTSFDVKFIFKEENKKYVHEYLKSFNLLQLLGGIGSRSRRCGGNFVIKSISNKSILDINEIKDDIYVEKWRSEKTLISYYESLSCIKNTKEKIIYSNIVSDKCKIGLCSFIKKQNRNKTKKSKKICKDLSEIKEFCCENTFKIEDYKTRLNIIGKTYKKLRSELKGNNKRGYSPLLIKVIRDGDEYKILLVKLAGKFAIEEKNIVDKLFDECSKNENIGGFLLLKGEDKNNE